MKRGLLVFAMVLSLWPVGAIAASALSDSSTTYNTDAGSSVTYDDQGGATVAVKDPVADRNATLAIDANGATYECPPDTNEKRAPYDSLAGQMQIEIDDVRQSLDRIEARYPNHVAPSSVVRRNNALVSREKRLVARFNRAVSKSNAVLESDCTVAGR